MSMRRSAGSLLGLGLRQPEFGLRSVILRFQYVRLSQGAGASRVFDVILQLLHANEVRLKRFNLSLIRAARITLGVQPAARPAVALDRDTPTNNSLFLPLITTFMILPSEIEPGLRQRRHVYR